MKSTGFVRKLDSLGRVTIPADLRVLLGLGIDAQIELFYDGTYIFLKKYVPGDYFTGEINDLVNYKDMKFSKSTIRKLVTLSGMKLVDSDEKEPKS